MDPNLTRQTSWEVHISIVILVSIKVDSHADIFCSLAVFSDNRHPTVEAVIQFLILCSSYNLTIVSLMAKQPQDATRETALAQ